MDEKWKIIYYETPQGKSPIFDFIQNLELKARTKVYNVVNLLQEFGTRVGLPHAKRLAGTELWELRILGGDSIRIFYVTIIGKAFLLLHGFKKKKQKTEQKEIKIALERLKEYRERLN